MDSDNCHHKHRTKSDGNVTNFQNISHKNLHRSLQDISPKPKHEKRLSTVKATESTELTQDIDYEDLFVETDSKDIKLESETAKMIFKDISEHRLSDKVVKDNCNHISSDDKQDESEDNLTNPPPADISSCKSVSVLNACQVLRLSDTSYCIRLANKQKLDQFKKKYGEK